MFAQRIAVIGGGPAGAFAATELARNGREVVLFDEKLAWEKPCGGGLTHKAITRWPFLRDAFLERNWVDSCELIAPSGRRVSFQLDRQIAIFSRLTLNGLLLDRARSAGAQVLRERITGISGGPGEWKLQSAASEYHADYLLLATGARNAFRQRFSPGLGPENFIVALGYYIPGTSHTAHIKFLEGLHGYIWIFPRADHYSAGICGRMQGENTADLRRRLEECLPEFGLSHAGASFYAHIIPSPTTQALRQLKCSGDGWALLGDAAGFVDSITGEGLYYAMLSGELCSRALLDDTPERYSELVRDPILSELERAASIADRFYAGEWLGGSVLERMVQLTGSSLRFRELMRDLFAGVQEYAGLKQRVYRSLPRIAAEALVSTLWQSPAKSIARAV
jgi:flavin-dependent dehydrogenase